MKKYRLYALPYTVEAVRTAERERFSRIAADYILIYTHRKRADGVEITNTEAHRLSAPERRWLYDCNTALIAEQSRRQQGEILQSLSDKIDKLEISLRKQREIEQGGENE